MCRRGYLRFDEPPTACRTCTTSLEEWKLVATTAELKSSLEFSSCTTFITFYIICKKSIRYINNPSVSTLSLWHSLFAKERSVRSSIFRLWSHSREFNCIVPSGSMTLELGTLSNAWATLSLKAWEEKQ